MENRCVFFSVSCFQCLTAEMKNLGGGVFLLEVQYSILKSLISTCVLSYVGSKERIGYLTESASLKRTAGIV